MAQAVHGACACGRNRWQVKFPPNPQELAEVFFDSSNATRAAHASPVTPWLRVPLEWYRSVTVAQFPDESALDIRRTFESSFSRRQFCGYCGTQLNSWNEHTRKDADYISLTVGSIFQEDMDLLEELGLLQSEEQEDEQDNQASMTSLAVQHPSQGVFSRGAPWFENMIEDTRFGRIKRQKGGRTSRDGNTRIEWEVVEITEDDGQATGISTHGKRKIGEVEEATADVIMK